MSHVDDALACFAEGFNCAQAMLATYGPLHGLDREACLRIASGFGGGMGRSGQTCGAVTGAIMALGSLSGYTEAADLETKNRCYSLVREFMKRFLARHGTVNCNELLGVDMGTQAGYAEAMARNTHTDVCPAFVRSAAEILEELARD